MQAVGTKGADAAPRVLGLDALRGWAVLAMALSGMVPWGALPQWMYHAQLIAPRMVYDLSVPGLTWVDLVFPFFLFSMGAAIPLALGPKWDAVGRRGAVAAGLARRFAWLVFFAIYVRHISPHVIANPPDARAWWLALVGFVGLFPLLTRLPERWTAGARLVVRWAGWGWCLGVLVYLNRAPGIGTGEVVRRIVSNSDIILLVLANVSLAGGVIWLLTRRSPAARLACMVAIVAIRVGHGRFALLNGVWEFTPAEWLYRFEYLQYLLILLPGTFAGEMLRRCVDRRPAEGGQESAGLAAILAGMLLATIVCVVAGLQVRLWGWTVAAATILLLGSGIAAVRGARSQDGRTMVRLLVWGAIWLAIGLALEPYEGGIKKDKATLSYYFVTGGLATFGLIVLSLAAERLGLRRLLTPLIDVGRNPLLAYAAIRSLLAPVVVLTGLEALLLAWLSTPWLGVLRAGIKTALLAAVVNWLTRRRIVWRA